MKLQWRKNRGDRSFYSSSNLLTINAKSYCAKAQIYWRPCTTSLELSQLNEPEDPGISWVYYAKKPEWIVFPPPLHKSQCSKSPQPRRITAEKILLVGTKKQLSRPRMFWKSQWLNSLSEVVRKKKKEKKRVAGIKVWCISCHRCWKQLNNVRTAQYTLLFEVFRAYAKAQAF